MNIIRPLLVCAVVALLPGSVFAATKQQAIQNLKDGREYRKGFAQGTRSFDTLITGWRDGSSYSDRGLLRIALTDLVTLFSANPTDSQLRQALIETAGELLQGASIEGNQSLLDALRMRYPTFSGAPPPRLPAPTGDVRQETQELSRAIEAFGLGCRAALSVLSLPEGESLLRASAGEYDGFPQFTQLAAPFNGDSSDLRYPTQVELSLLSRAADRMGQASVEKAKKLFNISAREDQQPPLADARGDALKELKRGAHTGYILAVAMGALQTSQQFQDNGGEKQLVHTKLGRELFTRIKSGMTPFGNSKAFTPNVSVSSYITRAKADVADARDAEIGARQEQRQYDQDQASLRNELQAQRDAFISPLLNLTNLDPRVNQDLDGDGRAGEKEQDGEDLDHDGVQGEYESFDILKTVRGRKLYRSIIGTRVAQLVNAPYVYGQTVSQVGQLGSQVLALQDSILTIRQAKNTIDNIPQRIAILNQTTLDKNELIFESGKTIAWLQAAEAIANSVTVSDVILGGTPGVIVTTNPSAGVAAGFKSREEWVRMLQNARTNDVETAGQVKTILLEQANAALDLDRAKLKYDQERTTLELSFQKLDQLISDYAETVSTSDNLWFNDPSYRITLSEKLSRATLLLDAAMVSLYELSRVLAYEWNEDYRNPVIIPTDVTGVGGTLNSSLYDQFKDPEDVFGLQTADQALDFLKAMREWDLKLRSIGTNFHSVRGPNRNSVPLTNRTISLRDDILGLIGNPAQPRDEETRILLFRDYLQSNLLKYPANAPTPGFNITFGLSIEIPNEPVQPLIPLFGRWNLRVAAVTIDTDAETGFLPASQPDCTYFLTQAGMISNASFFDSTENLEERIIMKYGVAGADRPERSVFRCEIPSKLITTNGQVGEVYERGQELSGATTPPTSARPLAATQYQLVFDPREAKNFGCNIGKLNDILITFKYKHGNPDEFTWPAL